MVFCIYLTLCLYSLLQLCLLSDSASAAFRSLRRSAIFRSRRGSVPSCTLLYTFNFGFCLFVVYDNNEEVTTRLNSLRPHDATVTPLVLYILV
jgi:hypothetical protein